MISNRNRRVRTRHNHDGRRRPSTAVQKHRIRSGARQRHVQHGVQSAGETGRRARSAENRTLAEHNRRSKDRARLCKRNKQSQGEYNNIALYILF